MKEAFQQQHEEEGDMVIGPMGRPVMTPEAMQRKMMRDRVKQDEVGMIAIQRWGQMLRSGRRKQGSGGRGWRSSQRTSGISCRSSPRRRRARKIGLWLRPSRRSAGSRQSEQESRFGPFPADESRELKDESYGVEMLHAIGRAYQAKATQHAVSHGRI